MKNIKENEYELPVIPAEALEAIKKGVQEKHSVSNLEQLGVSQRLINLLETNGIRDVSVLLTHQKETLLSIPNFGKRQLFILFSALSRYDELDSEYV
jgi:DNA-directed RNA polymerase alpha subunit